MAKKWDPLAMAPRLPLAYLLCDNQLISKFSNADLRKLGSCRQQLPRYKTRLVFPLGLKGEWGQLHGRTIPQLLGMHRSQGMPLGLEGESGLLHGRTVPQLLGMHRSQGMPLHPLSACQLRSL